MTGVSLFMFGMLLIKYSLQENFSERLKNLLHKFTANRFSSVLTGTAVTAALQSSSASSVLTAAFVDSGIISLYRAFWIIVGANLGTTFTGLLTAASFSDIAPVCCVFGIVFLSMTKKKIFTSLGVLLTGFGLLFVGMDIMENAVSDIRNHPVISDILLKSSSPVTGLLTGCFFTAVIQSSAATTALLQTMASDGIIGLRQAFYIILGANIGTCATCLVASMGLGGGAKKVSYMHIFYNFFGSLFFILIAEIVPLPELTEEIFTGNIKMQIAVINIVFNLSTAVLALFLPVSEKTFGNKSRKRRAAFAVSH